MCEDTENKSEVETIMEDFKLAYNMARNSDSWMRLNTAAARVLTDVYIKVLEYQVLNRKEPTE
jgi:hypothetical protein